ncbi:histone-lysine N-methyltransferase SETMAR-like [Ooceraea biroi]|uniref:histone-lysine N-methyltransferase SETMAR-like n=1 Tax=Ooceraea biroi TaxID=2015173 RepID=UPI000F08C11A|nr:histone-lysine N-methyltransferase SETMAR-like [Ooceraea biroi]
MELSKQQIRPILLYECKRGTNASQTHRNLCEVFGQDVITVRSCQFWFEKFRNGDFNLEDEPRSGRPSVIDKARLRSRVKETPDITTRELEAEFGVSHGTIINGLHQLGFASKLNKWVPHALSERNKLDRISKCVTLLNRHRNEPFLDRLITCDEKWIFYDNVVRKRSWCESESSAQRTPKRNIHGQKIMLSVWWDVRGIVYYELLPRNQTINTDLYCQQLERVQTKLKELRPQLVNRKGILFHQDNARPHVSALTLRKIGELNWELLEHPPYSPDLAPSDYHLFRSLQNFLNGKKSLRQTKSKES